MAILMGYWGIANDEGIRGQLRRLRNKQPHTAEHLATGPGWSVMVSVDSDPAGGAVPIMCGDRTGGWLAGSLFGPIDNGICRPSTELLDSWALSHATDAGLGSARWGRFALASVCDAGRTLILGRDALGLSRCYVARSSGGYVFASRLDTLVDLLGQRPGFDWEYLASWISHGTLPTSGSPLVSVRQVRPGALLRVDARSEQERFYWNPFQIAAMPGSTPSSPQVRETLTACTAAWAHAARRVFVDLSGGLDSSAVAWAIRDHPDAMAGYLDFGAMACADEYEYAQMVASRFGLGLHRISGDEVLPLTPVSTPAVRWDAPSPHLLQRHLNEVQTALGGAGAVHLSGGGGDQVFFARLETPLQLHDQTRANGVRYAARQAIAYSRHEGIPLSQLLGLIAQSEAARLLMPSRLVRRSAFALNAPRWLLEPHRCGDDCPRAAAAALAAGSGRLAAGKARHAAEIAFASGMADRDHRNPGGLPLTYPMLSLPLVEMALRTPTPALIDSERDRIVFRDAMAPVLPRPIAARQDKGDYTGMYQLGLRRNFRLAKELILDGHTASAGIIDTVAVIEDLQASALGHSQEMWPLQHLLAVEAWCRAWS